MFLAFSLVLLFLSFFFFFGAPFSKLKKKGNFSENLRKFPEKIILVHIFFTLIVWNKCDKDTRF